MATSNDVSICQAYDGKSATHHLRRVALYCSLSKSRPIYPACDLRPHATSYQTDYDSFQVVYSSAETSSIRFEKPHSLSYQLKIRPIPSGIIVVWSRWNMEDAE